MISEAEISLFFLIYYFFLSNDTVSLIQMLGKILLIC